MNRQGYVTNHVKIGKATLTVAFSLTFLRNGAPQVGLEPSNFPRRKSYSDLAGRTGLEVVPTSATG